MLDCALKTCTHPVSLRLLVFSLLRIISLRPKDSVRLEDKVDAEDINVDENYYFSVNAACPDTHGRKEVHVRCV